MSFLTITAYLSVLAMLSVCLLFSLRLIPFLVVPALLASIRFTGEVMQEEGLGPVWARHHLGDVGIISNNMIWGVTIAVLITVIKDSERLTRLRQPGASVGQALRSLGGMIAPRIPIAFLAISLLIYAVSILTELQTAFAPHTLNGEEAEANYSGEFDWPDAAAYTIGMTAMALNYALIGRRISKKTPEH